MNDAVNTDASVSDVVPETQAEKIETAVEKVLENEAQAAAASEPLVSSKLDAARAVYLTWRNQSLGGLPTESFNQIEQASASLIDAIAAL